MRTSVDLCAEMVIFRAYRISARANTSMATKISVLVADEEALRFEAFCNERGYKKSTLIARLIKEHLDREHYPFQGSLLINCVDNVQTSAVTKRT